MEAKPARRRDTLSPIASTSASPAATPPSTPPQRLRRYPSNLGRGDPAHVPLHRRGTSNTYERLEDLLREAGYKETRIFTPEHDKFPDGDKRGKPTEDNSKRGVGGAVVGFLAGLMPGNLKQPESEPDQDLDLSKPHSPESPLANRVSRKFTISPTSSLTNLASSDGSPSNSPRPTYNKQLYALRTNQRSIRPQASFNMPMPPPSAVHSLLRHMQSVPEMPRGRPNSAPVFILNDQESHPALPSTWLDSVKNAVLNSSVAGAHTGGPNLPPSRRIRKKENQPDTNQQRGRSNIRQFGTNLAPPQPLAPRLASTGPVTMINVVCRSAPGSRSSSVVRGSFQRGLLDIGSLDQELRGKGKERRKHRKRSVHMPSLVAARIDDEAWASDDPSSKVYHDDEEEEEEEEELNFRQLLIPARRQHSIQSLRRNLDRHPSLRTPKSGAGGLELWRPEDDSEDGSVRARRRGRQGSPEEMDVALPAKRRNGIPNKWSV